MAFRSFTPMCRMSETNEKTPSSIAQFIPTSSKLARTLTDTSRSSLSTSPGSSLNMSYLSQDEFSMTDAGDKSPTSADFDDFVSATSDANSDDDMSSTELSTVSPRLVNAAAATCVYSVSILLHLRAAVLGEDDADSSPLGYGTRDRSDFPPPSTTQKKPTPTSEADTASSWRSASANPEESWRQALPASGEDSWVAQQRTKATTDDDECVLRAARSILNKLTIEKFESLFEQLATCGISQPHHISILMREIFEKATIQHHFIPMYAELCVQLEKDPRIASVVAETDQLYNFRRLLLNQCQQVFEQVLESCGGDPDEDEEKAICRKQRALGNMKLIGQLLVHGMLSSDLFVECSEALLKKQPPCPEALEALVPLMMVAGPKFDTRSWTYYRRLENILQDMALLTKDKSVPPRLRFLFRDVLEARESGWPSSRHGNKVPAKLDEVRREAEEVPEATKTDQSGSASPDKKKSVKFCLSDAINAPVFYPKGTPAPFDVVAFRRTIANIFSDLATDKNIPAAVQRVRQENVPVERQAEQFVDILTRIVEERRGAVRRCELAFIAGLGAAETSAFDRKECLAGIGLFFSGVYDGLCHEVHRLPAIMKSEFMPTVLTVFPASDLNKVVPAAMRK